MPIADASTVAVSRRDDALVFDGVLTRPVVASAWRTALPLLGGVARIDLGAVSRVDSAGLAMLAALARRAGIDRIDGTPEHADVMGDARSGVGMDEEDRRDLACGIGAQRRLDRGRIGREALVDRRADHLAAVALGLHGP